MEIRSLSASFASSTVIGLFARDEKAIIRLSAPSSSRIFEITVLAIKRRTSSGTDRLSISAFLRKIAIRVSKSGLCISAIRPHSKRERKRSSKVSISLGGRSLEIIICLFASCRSEELRVGKECRSWCSSWRPPYH